MLKEFKTKMKFISVKLSQCLYYGAILSTLILLIGCASSKINFDASSVAKDSLKYGKSSNTFVANNTNALFYTS